MNFIQSNDMEIPYADMMNNLLSVFLSMVGGFFISVAFVSHYIAYKKDKDSVFDKVVSDTDTDTDLDTDTDIDTDTNLENMYYEELNALEEREMEIDELSALSTNIVEVDTPDGLVKMTYNHPTKSFWYYTNNKSIHYKYLDAVARHFTIIYNCKQICVNYKEEFEKGATFMKDKMNEESICKENKPVEKKTVFAKFKNYKVIDQTKQTKTNYILTHKANQFRFAGSMSDYDNENKQKIIKNIVIPTIDYTAFKKLFMAIKTDDDINNIITDETTRL